MRFRSFLISLLLAGILMLYAAMTVYETAKTSDPTIATDLTHNPNTANEPIPNLTTTADPTPDKITTTGSTLILNTATSPTPDQTNSKPAPRTTPDQPTTTHSIPASTTMMDPTSAPNTATDAEFSSGDGEYDVGNTIKCFVCELDSKEACLEKVTPNIIICENSSACIQVIRRDACFGTVDVMLVVDGSGSIGSANFQLVRRWLVNVTAALFEKMGHRVRTQVIQYANRDRRSDKIPVEESKQFAIPYTLNDRLSIDEISQRINDMEYLDSLTYTNFALTRTMIEFEKSVCKPTNKSIILFTDGKANDGASLLRWYSDNHDKLSKILAIGAGRGISVSELRTIANGDENDNGVITVDDFNNLPGIVDEIVEHIINSTKVEDTDEQPVSTVLGCGKSECNKNNSDGMERTKYSLAHSIKTTCCVDDYCNCNTTACVDAAKTHHTKERLSKIFNPPTSEIASEYTCVTSSIIIRWTKSSLGFGYIYKLQVKDMETKTIKETNVQILLIKEAHIKISSSSSKSCIITTKFYVSINVDVIVKVIARRLEHQIKTISEVIYQRVTPTNRMTFVDLN